MFTQWKLENRSIKRTYQITLSKRRTGKPCFPSAFSGRAWDVPGSDRELGESKRLLDQEERPSFRQERGNENYTPEN